MKKLFAIIFLFSLLTLAQNFEWEWQNPKPNGNDYNDAIYFSDGKIMLFGNSGVILRSTNGGNTWQTQYVDSVGRSIYEADFVDNNNGYIVGTSGLMMKTTDGGNSWTNVSNGSTTTLWYVDFFDANTGLITGASGTVLRTTDGGATWNSHNHGTATNYAIHYVNANLVYLGSSSSTTGRLIRSTDGGVTWADITANVGFTGSPTVRGVHFINADTGWISTTLYDVYKTTNAGTSWVNQGDYGTGTFYEVKFFNANDGLMAGATGRIYKTSNGGTTWDSIQSSATLNMYGLGLKGLMGEMFDGQSAVVAGEAGTVLVTTDKGATWAAKYSSVTQELMRRHFMLSGTTGYTVGGSASTTAGFGDVLKTTDGGSTWIKMPGSTNYRLYSIYMNDVNNGFVGSRGPDGIFKTTDGGNTFTQLTPGAATSTGIWYDIEFANATTGFAGGSSGVLVKTADGGTTWSALAPGFGTSVIYDMTMTDANTLYICGSSGKVSKSTDQGATFTPQTTGTTSALYAIQFVNSNLGYFCGSSGRVHKTTDGGATWTQLTTTGITATLYAVEFLNESIGWIAGSGGKAYFTTDGGNVWSPIKSVLGSTITIYDIAAKDGFLWMTGTDGTIIRGYADPLIPVELESFAASVNETEVTLNWITATETNNRGFELERKSSNSNFELVAFIAGKGNASEKNYYSFNDNLSLGGKYWYRLKQIDLDGSFTYSNEVSVDINQPVEYSLQQNYPNPFNPVTTINYSLPMEGLVRITIYNSLGEKVAQLVNEIKIAGHHSVQFDASKHSSGLYFYKLESAEFSSVKKMTILK